MPTHHPEPTNPWPPAFSETYVAQARALLEDRSVLLIVGPAGSNRQDLASAVAELRSGLERSRHLARAGEQDQPYFTLHQVVRGLTTKSGEPLDAVVKRAASLLRANFAGGTPTIVLLEADLCDDQSLQALARLADGRLKVIATVSAAALVSIAPLTTYSHRLDLEALDHTTVRTLLQARFGSDPHPTVVDFLRERSEGAYGVLRELADAAHSAGMLRDSEGVLMMDETATAATVQLITHSMTPRTAARIGGSQDITDLLHVAALMGELDVAEVQARFGRTVLDAAIRHGALRRIDGAAVFTSSAEAAVIRRTMTPARRQDLFTAYADTFERSCHRRGSVIRCADWWRSTQRLLPPDLAREAACQANAQGHYRRTVTFTDPKWIEGGVMVAPIERAYALIELDETQALWTLLRSIDPADLTDDELLHYARWSARLLVDDPTIASRAVARSDTHERRRRLAIMSVAELSEGVFDDGDQDVARRLRVLAFSDVLPPTSRAMAFTTLAHVQRHGGDPVLAARTARAALDLLDDPSGQASVVDLGPARESLIAALIMAVDLDAAEVALADYSAASMLYAGTARLGSCLWAMLEFARGETTQALANIRRALMHAKTSDPHRVRGWIEAMFAQLLAQQHRHEEAETALAESAAHPPTGRLVHDLARRLMLAHAHDALGDPDRAIELLEAAAKDAHAHHFRTLEIDSATLLVQIGGPSYLPRLLDAVDTTAVLSGTCAIWRDFARACATDDVDRLIAMAHDLSGRGAAVFAAEIAQYTLDVHRDDGRLGVEQWPTLDVIADPMAHRAALPLG